MPPDAHPPRKATEQATEKATEKPRRYLPKSHRVAAWHAYLVAATGENPSLKVLASSCGLAMSTVHRLCVAQGLPLSQKWHRDDAP